MDSKVGLWRVPYLHEVLSFPALSLRSDTRVRFFFNHWSDMSGWL